MERKTLKKKILGIFCTLCLCICMTSISTTMTLQRQSGTRWSDVTSWFDSTTGYNLILSKNYVAGTRGNYRVRAVYTVNGETITTYSSTVTY